MKFFFIFALAFTCTYLLTDNSYSPISSREPSSVTDEKETRNSYANLRCPSEKEFMSWSAELKMEPMAGESLDLGCKKQTYRTQMAQVLGLMRDIKFNFANDWAPTVQNEIANPYEYLKKNVNKLKLDLSQVNSIARNNTALKQIELGGAFFKDDPLGAISTLIHEARHSDSRDQGHALCRIGDIPKAQGGCDYYFSNKSENAGAYSYDVLFSFAAAQYSPNLDQAERELMITSGLSTLSTRFNHFNSSLAKHMDIITVLLDDGSLAWLHPFTFELIPLKVSLPVFEERIKKIEFFTRTNAFLMFTESNRMFGWNPLTQKAKRILKDGTTDDDRFIHVSTQYVPYDNDRTSYTLLRTNGQMEYAKFNPDKSKFELYPYPLHTSNYDANPTYPNLKHFFAGHGMNSYFIDKQGILSRAHHYGNEPNFVVIPEIQSSSGGWLTGTGGVFFDDLILIDSDSKIQNIAVQIVTKEEDSWAEVFEKSTFAFQAAGRAKKYQQGLQVHAVLDDEGGLLIENYRVKDSQNYFRHLNKKIVDFVISRVTTAEAKVLNQQQLDKTLMSKCNIKKVIEPIGFGSALALNNDSKLISASADGRCTDLSKNKNWTHAELFGVDDKAAVSSEKQPFPDIYLKATNQNEKLIWTPYTRSTFDQSK